MNMGPRSGAETGDREATSPRRDDACCTAVGHDLSDYRIERDVQLLAAMGNETRYTVLRLLSGASGPVCACDLEPELAVDQSTASRALKRLYEAELVDRRKDGRWRYYSTTDRAERLLSTLDALGGA
ncbi:MAG: metalloregulator ArsR/SmtB family transcription factor [Halodesulfurarchaeum sp.]|nr:metalloregulator ArsR/SmtB family transcription factor [Halodesulfurarchaeum sp.]